MNIEDYQPYLNRQVSYMKHGKVKTGKFVNISYEDESARLMASIEVKNGLSIVSWKSMDCVPIRQVKLPNLNGSQSNSVASRTRSKTSGCAVPRTTQPNGTLYASYMLFNQIRYDSFKLPWLRLGEQVVWILPERVSDNVTYIGTIKFIGKHESIQGREEIVALVEFDQNTEHLPRLFSKSEKGYLNVIDMEELLKVEDAFSDQGELPSKSPEEAEPDIPLTLPTVALLKTRLSDDNPPVLSRFPSQTKALRSPRLWNQRIDLVDFVATIASGNEPCGIQGHNNSCYMDASLFALFVFNHSLDDCISFKLVDAQQRQDTVKTILRESIILPLRTKYFVPCHNTQLLREILGHAEDGDKFLNSFVDAEDFLLSLFEHLDLPPMFQYDNGGTDYVHQILFPSSLDTATKADCLTLQTLLNGSFMTSNVKLSRPPDGLFIIKLPVSNGILIPCEKVIPNLTLDLVEILAENYQSRKVSKRLLNLSAIICFHKSHYVALARTGKDLDSPWIFMDSSPTNSKPEVVLLKHTSKLLAELESSLGCNNLNSLVPEQELQFVNRILRDAYICIYD